MTTKFDPRELMTILMEAPYWLKHWHYKVWHEDAKEMLSPEDLERYEFVMAKKRLEE